MLAVAVNLFALPASADWEKDADGKHYYYIGRGKYKTKVTGWYKIDKNYYYFNSDGVFLRNGTEDAYALMTDGFAKYLGYDNYAGSYVAGGLCYIRVKDVAAATAIALRQFPDFDRRPVTFILAEYSKNELESSRDAFKGMGASDIDPISNRAIIYVSKITSDLIKLKQSLPYGGCIVFNEVRNAVSGED